MAFCYIWDPVLPPPIDSVAKGIPFCSSSLLGGSVDSELRVRVLMGNPVLYLVVARKDWP